VSGTSGTSYYLTYAFFENQSDVASSGYASGTSYTSALGLADYANWASFGTNGIEANINAILATPSGTDFNVYFGDVAQVNFTQVSDSSSTVAMGIGMASYNSSVFPDSTDAAITYTTVGSISQGSVSGTITEGMYGDTWFNSDFSLWTDSSNWSSIAAGTQAFLIVLHELSHSLGENLDASDTSWLNNQQFTIESVNHVTGMSVSPSGLQLEDILAIQSIYGANYAERSGNTVYGFGHGFAPPPGTSTPGEFIYTIWDGGGINVIDASSYTAAALIDLNEGSLSSIGPADPISGVAQSAVGNVAIAYGAVIQNAIGSQGTDILIGNQWNNVLAGAPSSSGNTFYSDGLLDGVRPIDWSHNGNPSLVGTQWSAPTTGTGQYVPPPGTSGAATVLKEDVLIGDGSGNTFYSGKANNVIDGGFNKADINSATEALVSGWGTSTASNYWDSAYQFTATPGTSVVNNVSGTALTDLSLAASGGNIADYSQLSVEDSSIKPGSPGITLSWSGQDSNDYGIGTVQKGASGSGDGTDTLLSIEKVVGTAGDDVFNGFPLADATGGYHGAEVYYYGVGGNDQYNFTLNSSFTVPLVHIVDSSGANTLTVNHASTDAMMQIYDGPSLSYTYHTADLFFWGASGSGSGSINGNAIEVIFNTQEVQTAVIDGYHFRTSDLINVPSGQTVDFDWHDLYGSSSGMPGGGAPTVNDPGTGSVIGQTVSPAVGDGSGGSGSNGGGGTAAWGEFDYAADTMHPMVLTSFASDTAYWQTWVKDINLLGITPDDVTLKWSGASTDTLTISVASLSKAIDITHFTSGQELFGIAVEDTTIASAISADSGATLTSTGLGDYTGNYSAGNGMESMTFGSVDVTYFLETLTLGGGTVWDMQSGGLTFTSATSGDTLYARDGHNDTLLAQASSETLIGSTGDTTMISAPGSNVYNGTGADTDVFSVGMAPVSGGGDTIHENTSGSITIAFHGIDPSAVMMWDNSSGYLMVQYSPTDQITVAGGVLDSSTGFALGSLTSITFDDSGSTTWDTSVGLNLVAASDYQTLYGTTSGGDTLTALGIGDTLYAYAGTEALVAGVGSTLYNGTGTDTDVFSAGKAPISGGGDYLYENTGAGTGVIAFHGIDPSAVTMWDNSSGYFVVHYSSTDQVTVIGGTLDSSGFTLGSLHSITFDDIGGTTWDTTGALNMTATSDYQAIYGTSSGGDTLTAGGTGDTLYGYAGTETLVAGPASTLYNGTGTNTDVFSAGKSPISGGGDYLYESTTTGTGTIAFHGIDPSAVTMWDNSSGYFMVHYSSTDQFTVIGGTLDYSTGFALGSLTGITFDDTAHTTVDLTGSLNQTAISDSQSIYGSGHGDTMTALGDGDTLNGIAGNNTMIGHTSGTTYFLAGSGDDVMVGMGGTNYMTAGSGTDTVKIDDASSSTYVSSFSTGDKLDIADILDPVYDPVHAALGNFVQEATSGGNTTFSVDTTGTATFTTPLVTLTGVTGLDDVATLVANGHLIVHS